jgi:squalene-associated FAD-dependent desaturase
VFRESFLKSAAAGRMGVPAVPLSELYGVAGEFIRARGGEVRLRASVESFRASEQGVTLSVGGEEVKTDFAVLAVPFDVLSKLLPSENGFAPLQQKLQRFEHSPITGVHFWFDREVTALPHAVLLDRTIQWMFNKSRIQGAEVRGQEAGSYLELVISSSKTLVEKGKQEILDLALRELAEFFPAVKPATVVKSTVIKEIKATYSASPKSDEFRPKSATPYPRLFLAGDWTLTGWPATMEGAVRSGHIAADALLKSAGENARYLLPDLKPAGLMRLFE